MLNTSKITITEVKAAETAELLETYNHITGKNIKKFSSRDAAINQTWKAIQQLPSGEETDTVQKVKKLGKRENYESRTIQVLIKENPKRADSKAHKKFEVLLKMNGKTIHDLKNEEGQHPELDKEAGWPATELRWAIKLGLVKLIFQEAKAA